MTYAEVLQYLYAQLPMFQRIGKAAFKKDLTNTLKLMDVLNHPEKKFKSVHIAGTNGKGSVSNLIAAALQKNNLKVGLYTSPHLKDFRERIKINGQSIGKKYVIDFVLKHQSSFETIQPSFFEWTVALAFDYFANKKVDIAVIETGMGGRLDSTNIIFPKLSVITNIGFDHTEFLGDTLEKIAAEKAGIIKPKTPVIIGRFQPQTEKVFIQTANSKNSKIIFAAQQNTPTLQTDLKGGYQSENLKTAYIALKELKKSFPINLNLCKQGFKDVYRLTKFSGRWQTISNNPKVICDVGHNVDGINWVLENLKTEKFKTLHFVLGMVSDKNHDEILALLPKNAHYYFCKPNVPRGLSVEILHEKAQKFQLKGKTYSSVKQALNSAKKHYSPQDLILIGGSTFVVAEVL